MKRLMIVDDDVFTISALKNLISSYDGYETATIAYDVDSALEKITKTRDIQLLLLDMQLRDGLSLDLMLQLRERSIRVPILILRIYP